MFSFKVNNIVASSLRLHHYFSLPCFPDFRGKGGYKGGYTYRYNIVNGDRPTYPCSSASRMNPLRFFSCRLKLPGHAFRASEAPPTSKISAFPVPSFDSSHAMLSLLHMHEPGTRIQMCKHAIFLIKRQTCIFLYLFVHSTCYTICDNAEIYHNNEVGMSPDLLCLH